MIMNPAKASFNPNKHSIYTPINENKYVDKDVIICKSSWELAFCQWCDNNDNILRWGSETIAVPYFDPVKRKQRRYFPDFTILLRDVNGNINKYIVEIKPYKETILPIKGNKKENTYLYEFYTYQTNVAKWKSAVAFCKKYGFEFKILTEKDIFKIKK